MIKKLALSLTSAAALALGTATVNADADFFGNGFIVLNINGAGNTFYDLNPPANTLNPDFNGANLGVFDPANGDSIILSGAEFNTFQNNGDNVNSVNLNYRIYSGTVPNFSTFSVDFVSQNGNDKFWQSTDENITLLSNLSPGTYTFEVFGSADTTAGPRFYSNNAANYSASFTVVPEPSSLSVLAGPAILGAWFFVRRRRA